MQRREGYVTTGDGIRLFFQSVGDAPQTLLFPNGIYLVDDFTYLADDRTVIFYDVRNRGRSDAVSDPSQLQNGIHHDVDDLDAVRRHFGLDTVDVIGHSYMGLMVALYALKYAAHVARVVQLCPMEPRQGMQYPAHLTGVDDTLREFFAKSSQLFKERQSVEPEEFCRRFWSILRIIYVADPADAHKIRWDRCDQPNERHFMKYWTEHLLPSIQRLDLTKDNLARVQVPILIVHGTKDRSAAYGGARDWATILPNARLVTIHNAAHAPWIESPAEVFDSVKAFLHGSWPATAETLSS